MARLILTRLGVALATLFAVSVVVFCGVAALPGDAAQGVLGAEATPDRLEALREKFDLNRPLVERYVDWLAGFVHGDLGRSLVADAPVWSLLDDRARNTAALTIFAVLVLVPLAVVLGVLSALWRNSLFDHSVATSSLTLVSTPEFVTGTLLAVLFSFGLGLLPGASLIDSSKPITEQFDLIILPVLTLVAAAVAQATRMIRATMIETLQADFIQAAILRGVPRGRLLFRHALPNAFGPTAQILALTIGWLVGGVVVTETLFQYPGLGSAFASAVSARDLPTVQAVAMIVTAVYVLANLAAEVGALVLNPRLRRRTA
jgi:peptide/nickel transport system permease protein